MLFQDLPQELISQVISNLNKRDILSFLQCHASSYYRSLYDSFWFDLCRLHGIRYCHPDISWKDLFCSDQVSSMCPHLNTNLFNTRFIREKKQLLWSSFDQRTEAKDRELCLHPSCDFLGESESCTDHYAATKHNLSIKITQLHTLEIWCNTCVKTIGFDYFASNVKQGLKSESYIMKKLTKKLALVTQETDSQELALSITKGRQEIESGIFRIQFRNSTMHLVEKDWYTTWLAFISGQSTEIPGDLNNESLFLSDGSLNPTLSLGKHFELIGNLTRWYIERVYSVSGKIISSNELLEAPEYCKLAHSIRIRQQMNQAARYSAYGSNGRISKVNPRY
ncbi:uncharacterized protein EV154DRAFT_519026 [Mucor mucedo]|uniref:uncharacterized protein n=1 Tax=Mucor mucedo TaxID=29922 RepID=UPI0022200412|nr:uncharacterized protein EV154DRAFT_519026 [Mucor mucedo]KAI7888033.1 hypothetical protein EV154DRAFT_519026 [Mucor mucedo]